PSFGNVRPPQDISIGLSGGPTDWDAALALSIRTATGTTDPSAWTCSTRALGSRGPTGFTPLNKNAARPSQKVRKLKMALMAVGVLRPVARRTFLPPTFQTGSATGLQLSTALPGTTSRKSLSNTPCEPMTSSASDRTGDPRSTGFWKRWKGNCPGVTVPLGPATSKVPEWPGVSSFFIRLSAPAWK